MIAIEPNASTGGFIDLPFDPNGYFQNDIFMRGIGVDGLGGGGPLSNSEISALPPVSDHHAQFLSGLVGFSGGLVAGAVGASILGPVSLGMSQAALLAPFVPVFANALADQWADFQNSSVSEKAFAVGSLIGGSCGFGVSGVRAGTNVLKPLGRGVTGRIEAKNLVERLAMQEIIDNPYAGRVVKKSLGDPRWKGWAKMSNQNAHGIEIHFNALWDDSVIKAIDDFKFIDP
ncbi:MAG: hypothetical protein H3C47_15895 [Candidatus Cloacimonetes bacterium]|nr:hypothetical protein [Candidatus Cloacimonadota bacterium]